MNRLIAFCAALVVPCLLLAPAPAAAQAAGPAEPGPEQSPRLSLALERVGGASVATVWADDGDRDSSLNVNAIGIGGAAVNPFAFPRLGVDYISGSGLTLGGAVGVSRLSATVHEGNESEGVGSLLLYTLTPRVGYRFALTRRLDLTPRAGVTFLGGSLSAAETDDRASIFAVAVGADVPFAFRLTRSFNVLAGVGLDYVVSASASTRLDEGLGGGTSSNSGSVDGSLLSVNFWLGLGGYL